MARLALFDLDNTLLDREAAFAIWAQGFIESNVLAPKTGSAIERADEDGFKPRDLFFAQLREELGISTGIDDLLVQYYVEDRKSTRLNSITKPPSAELAPGQMDTDSLPPYDVLDALLDDYVEKDMGTAELIAAGHDPALVERVVRMVDAAEYKRRQYPPGPKISQKNFGRDRRLPITSRWRPK